jgi:hypothetical protein
MRSHRYQCFHCGEVVLPGAEHRHPVEEIEGWSKSSPPAAPGYHKRRVTWDEEGTLMGADIIVPDCLLGGLFTFEPVR